MHMHLAIAHAKCSVYVNITTQIALSLWRSKVMRGRYQEQLQAFLKIDKGEGRFRALWPRLWPPKKLILGVLFISEGEREGLWKLF